MVGPESFRRFVKMSSSEDQSSSAVGSRAPWILVVGSGQRTLRPTVFSVARQVGSALAKAGFNLATFGWHGVDEIVAYSFAEATGLPEVEEAVRLYSLNGKIVKQGDRVF